MRISKISWLLLLGWLFGGAAVFAHTGATGIVKHRMDSMSQIAKKMRLISAIMTEEKPFNATTVKDAALAIADHARKIPEFFPEGSGAKPSEALPAIWTNWEKFIQIATELETSAQNLAATADDASVASDVRPPFIEVTVSCKSCHKTFRIPK